jgi:serine/threonine protein kinase
MKHLSDRIVARLREVTDYPDLSGTRYRLVSRLGQGGMGTVYRVEDTALGREVALKVLADPDPRPELSERLLREARHLARLEHPNIVPVHDAGRLPDGRAFYVMKYVRGRRLDEWRRGEPSRPAVLRMFQKICEAVAFAHAQGVVHRDLKPENVMVGPFGEALIMDWGVAKALGGGADEPGGEAGHDGAPKGDGAGTGASRRLTAHGAVMGTPAYMAPEQARGEVERIDERADVYALGALLYFLLAGSAPGPSVIETAGTGTGRWAPPPPFRRVALDVPRALESICRRAMAADPGDRYGGAQQMAADVDRFLDGRPVEAHPESPPERIARFLRRHQALAWLVAAYVLMRLAVLWLTGR